MANHSKRRKIPLLRIFLLGAIIWFLHNQFTSGWFAQFWDSRVPTVQPISKPQQAKPSIIDSTWSSWCESRLGTPFVLKNKLGQCSWTFSSRTQMRTILAQEPPQITNRLFYAADLLLGTYPLRLHWVAPQDSFVQASVLVMQNSLQTLRLIRTSNDSSEYAWIDVATGCAFPGPCPHTPLEGGAIPIPTDFDFAGREHLISKDLFQGIGESPVFPVMPGKVFAIQQDSTGYSVTLYHGKNLYSRSSGLASLYPGVVVTSMQLTHEPVGRLSSQDTATLYFEFLRNGKFVRWSDFWQETHPLTSERISTFRKSIGY